MLTSENYHSPEANQQYMSCSQYKSFLQCQAATMAELRGEYAPVDPNVYLVGNYVHSWAEGTLEEFKEKHPEIISSRGATKGQLKTEFKKADKMIETLQNDKAIMYLLNGQKEVILTAEFAGTQWKAKVDIYNPEQGYIADLKTCESLSKRVWSDEYRMYLNFVEGYRYTTQMAIYCETERLATGRDKWLEPLIIAVTKEDPPDKAVINFDSDRLKAELEEIKLNMPDILVVKDGKQEPERCEKCAYCRETKQIKKFIHFSEL